MSRLGWTKHPNIPNPQWLLDCFMALTERVRYVTYLKRRFIIETCLRSQLFIGKSLDRQLVQSISLSCWNAWRAQECRSGCRSCDSTRPATVIAISGSDAARLRSSGRRCVTPRIKLFVLGSAGALTARMLVTTLRLREETGQPRHYLRWWKPSCRSGSVAGAPSNFGTQPGTVLDLMPALRQYSLGIRPRKPHGALNPSKLDASYDVHQNALRRLVLK